MTEVPGPADYTGSKDPHTNLNFRVEEGLTVQIGPVADRDEPYRVGRASQASAACPWPFNQRQLARLLILRGLVQNRRLTNDL